MGGRLRLGKQAIGAVLGVAVAASVGAGSWAGYLRLTGNIHEVEPGLVYRSGQLSAVQLRELIRDKSIRALLNLRGENRGQPWYDSEVSTAREGGVEHIDLHLSATRAPGDAVIERLVKILRFSPKPLLIHCEGGADRTGLAAALYELKVEGKPLAIADEQLSFRFGHFPWLLSETGAMDRAFVRSTELPEQEASEAH